jgi:signal transduction histidine kinase
VEVEVSPWEHAFAGARYRVCMVRDVTQRLRAQAERELLIGELERKNLELERFLYTASHDLKTPLTTIKGFTGLLAEDFSHDDREAVSKDLARIDDAVDHMIALLNDLLHLSRIGSLEASRERVCLAELAATVLEDLAAARPGLQGRVRISPDLPCAEGNRALLAEVFAKLIDNAVKFSPPRGEGGPSWPDIEIAATTGDGNEPAVCVRDRGEGVDERYRENIFGLFNQLDPRVPGTGVGLTIVRRIVELHGGRIWVRSRTDGPGAAFCFTLRGCEEAPA